MKYSTKKIHFNPKKKRKNKNHKQHYWKRENKKIDKSKFIEVKGNREELKPFLNKKFKSQGFLTNSYRYDETKRLINSLILPIKIDNKNIYINHVWVNAEKVKNVQHGFKKFIVEIIQYKDLYNNKPKYGIEVLEVI
jgi:hypothetical protein